MREEYDVVVAGGGPAGLQFAREVAGRSDRSVAVLEANDALSDNDKSTGGTFHQVIEGYDVPDDVVMDTTDAVTFEGPTATTDVPIPGYVLDFPAFLEFLGADAEARGAEVHTGTRVLDPILEDGVVSGVQHVRDGAPGTVEADLVVDATGPAAALTEPLGMFDPDGARHAVGKEYEVEGAYDVDDAMVFAFDHDVAPGGYAWTFPAGDEVFKAGVCWVDDFYERHGDGRRIDAYVEDWIEGDDRWSAGEVRAVHAGDASLNHSMNRRADDGIVAVGDAVSSISPLFGEGIRPGMQSAEMAADVALSALAEGDVSRDRLREYERRWNEECGRYWRLHVLVGELLYDFDADQQDRFVRKVRGLSDDQIDRLQRYEVGLSDVLDVYPFDPSDVRRIPSLVRQLRT